MGNSLTSSRLERRNTVLRRSQRKSMLSVKSRIENVFKDIKRMKSTEEDEQYNKIKSKIEECEKELLRKSREIMPQIRGLREEAQQKIFRAQTLLAEKLKENREKAEQKQKEEAEKRKEAGEGEQIKEHGESDEVLEELERQRDMGVNPDATQNEPDSSDKRQTVQLKLFKVETPQLPNNHITESLSRNEEKRKSIMKIGVPVFPSLGGIVTRNSSSSSKHVEIKEDIDVIARRAEKELEEHSTKIFGSEEWLDRLKKDIQETEEEISKFVGKKNGVHYNQLKEKLFNYLDTLSSKEFRDNEVPEQLKRYINSCFSFLDEIALDDVDDDDEEVFLPDLGPRMSHAGFKITSI